MNVAAAVAKLITKDSRARRFLNLAQPIQYIPCPYNCDGLLIRYTYDAAKCSECGVEERYLD